MCAFVCAYLHQYSNVCSVCTQCGHTALYLHSANAASWNDQIHNHPSHTHSCLCLCTLHLVATSALLHTDQRSHSRFRPHSLSWFGEWTMRYTTTDWLLSNCQRIAMIKMKLALNSLGKIFEPSEKPAVASAESGHPKKRDNNVYGMEWKMTTEKNRHYWEYSYKYRKDDINSSANKKSWDRFGRLEAAWNNSRIQCFYSFHAFQLGTRPNKKKKRKRRKKLYISIQVCDDWLKWGKRCAQYRYIQYGKIRTHSSSKSIVISLECEAPKCDSTQRYT